MTNHPRRSRGPREVVLKITDGGRIVGCHPRSTSDMAVRVREVPADVRTSDVVLRLCGICWRPATGPWTVAWERIANAAPGSMLEFERWRRPE